MRVVAMSLKIVIILFILVDHKSDGSSFPSTSTYLQSKSSWCPTLNSQALRGRMSNVWPITHLFSHIKVMIWAYYQCHGHIWDCTFQTEGNSTHRGTQFFLSWWISDNMCGTSVSSAFSVTASHEYTVQNLFWREKMSFQTPKQNHLDNEIKQRLRKNTLLAAISIGSDFPPRENRRCHLTWPTPRAIWEDMGAQQGGLLATDIFLETDRERVTISCKSHFIAFVSNTPQKHRQGLGNDIVPYNVACIQISLSLSNSLCRLLPPLTFSQILLIQGYLCWSSLANLSQESSQILSPRLSIRLPNSYQIWKHFSGNNSSVCMEIFHLTECTPILPVSALHTDR